MWLYFFRVINLSEMAQIHFSLPNYDLNNETFSVIRPILAASNTIELRKQHSSNLFIGHIYGSPMVYGYRWQWSRLFLMFEVMKTIITTV